MIYIESPEPTKRAPENNFALQKNFWEEEKERSDIRLFGKKLCGEVYFDEGPRGRMFKSCHSDQTKRRVFCPSFFVALIKVFI